MPQSQRSSRSHFGVVILAAIALGVSACAGAGASSVPTLPAGAPTLPPSGLASACLDSDTMAVLDQLKATGADAPTILAANKDKLTSGLQGMQPTDPTVVTWRDALVAAINSNDASAIAAQVAMLSSGQVTLATC